MTAQTLDRTLTGFRIGDPAGAYPIFDATGSTLAPGRWNTPGSPVIHASEHYSTALLEKPMSDAAEPRPGQQRHHGAGRRDRKKLGVQQGFIGSLWSI